MWAPPNNVQNATGKATINSSLGFDALNCGIGDDQIKGLEGCDIIDCDAGYDSLEGNSEFDNILRGGDDDHLAVGIANERIGGGADNETLEGNVDFESLVGGKSDKYLEETFGNDPTDGDLDRVSAGVFAYFTGNEVIAGGLPGTLFSDIGDFSSNSAGEHPVLELSLLTPWGNILTTVGITIASEIDDQFFIA